MAFNREDLITWHELATSLQTMLKNLVSTDDSITTKLDQNIEFTNELEVRVTALEGGGGVKPIPEIVEELDLATNVSESTLLYNILLLKAQLEYHKISPDAHRQAINQLITEKNDGIYSALDKCKLEVNLKNLLETEAADHSITNSVDLDTDYIIGSASKTPVPDYGNIVLTIVQDWIERFEDTSIDTVSELMVSLYRDICIHIADTKAHDFHNSIYTSKHRAFMFERAYKVWLPSKSLATGGFVPPNFDDLEVDKEHPSKAFGAILELYFEHLTSTSDHGLNTLEMLFHTEHEGFDTLTLAHINTDKFYNIILEGRNNTREGGIDGLASVEGLTYPAFEKYIDTIPEDYDEETLEREEILYDDHVDPTKPNPHDVDDISFMMHQTNTSYEVGDKVFLCGVQSNLCLVCTTAGTTDNVPPVVPTKTSTLPENTGSGDSGSTGDDEIDEVLGDLAEEIAALKLEVKRLKDKIASGQLKDDQDIDPTLLERAVEVRTRLIDHIYGSSAHVDNSSSYLTHSTDYVYKQGETVYAPKLMRGLRLECQRAGMTASTSPTDIEDLPVKPDIPECDAETFNAYVLATESIYNQHVSDPNAHGNIFGQYIIRRPNTAYNVGELVEHEDVTPYRLECVVSGTTSNSKSPLISDDNR